MFSAGYFETENKAKYFEEAQEAKRFFRALGSFGEISGDIVRSGQTLTNETADYKMTCTYEQDDFGVFSRRDSFCNASDKPLSVSCLRSRFVFEGGEYEVYTQYNGWQKESLGAWQPLVSAVSVAGSATRTTHGAAPFLVLWSKQAQRGVAFHLLPGCAWEMQVSRVMYFGKYTKILVELGIQDYNFDLTLAPGETVHMPEILCYEIRNKTHMDCYKLHHYMHNHYPRRCLPMLYNTWMYRFTQFTVEGLFEQVDLAAELGLEYFVVDAGWFGKGDSWFAGVGDWSENLTGGLFGRMGELADRVRARGMQFGLWLEPERAGAASDAVAEHSDYFYRDGDHYFFDFSKEPAREWMLSVLSGLIDRYGIDFIKDDYNASSYYDVHHSAFLKYHEGHAKFIEALRKRHPDLYLSACAGGGERMELNNYIKFDSFWPSDNEGPYEEMRIYKDTILRLPPQGFEKWAVIHSLQHMEAHYKPFAGECSDKTERLIASNDAVWSDVTGVHMSYMKGYLTGCPIGFSCDLTALSPKAREEFKQFIAGVKAERAFWQTAVARILCDTESLTVFQYSDMALSKIVVQAFTHQTLQDAACVYPEVDETKRYQINGGEIVSGRELMSEGIVIDTPDWHEMIQLTLTEVI